MAAWKIALLAGALALSALPWSWSASEAAAGTPRLLSLKAGYGPETWKDQPPVGAVVPSVGAPAPPAPMLGVYVNPYANGRPHQGLQTWLGYNLTVSIEIDDGQGRADPNPANSIGARLETASGTIPALLARTGPGQFLAQFDLDGEDGASFPAAMAGPGRIAVQVNRSNIDPTLPASPVAVGEFFVTIHAGSLGRAAIAVDDAVLPGYGDVGAGNQTALLPGITPLAQTLELSADLGAPNASASIVAWDGAQPTLISQGMTDADGRLQATATAQQLTANASGLVIVEAHLDGAQAQLASATLGIVVSSHPARATDYFYEQRGVQGQGAGPADALRVTIDDPTAGDQRPVRGQLFALGSAGQILSEGAFDPTTFGPAGFARVGRILAASLPADTSSYRILAFLESQDGRVYSMAYAARGYSVRTASMGGSPFHAGTVNVIVRNLNSNFDQTLDPGLALQVHVRVTGQPGSPVETVVQASEGGEARLEVPYSGEAGSYTLTINTTSGELRQTARSDLVIAKQAQGLLGIPGPESLAAVAIGILAAAVQRRKTAP